jgi:hypothetical protein
MGLPMADPQPLKSVKSERVRPQIKVSGMVADGLGLDKRLCRQAPDRAWWMGCYAVEGGSSVKVRRLRYNSTFIHNINNLHIIII